MTSTNTIHSKPDWNLAQLVFFRFFCIYFVLYIFPFPVYFIPWASNLTPYYSQLLESITLWFGTAIFNITDAIDATPNGSGDRLFNYVAMFTNAIIAVVGTLIWSVIDYKRKSYYKTLTVLSVYVRYYLAMNLLSYGFSKVFTNQFSELSLGDYLKTYGESSPMGLVWNLMEYSDQYTIFSGLAEVIPGLLLLFRRTTLLGAVLAAGVMLNVFMLNMSFDVPVKIFSGHLLIMSIFLVTLSGKRLLNVFILNRSIEKKQITNYFSPRKWNIAQYIIKAALIFYLVYLPLEGGYYGQREWGKLAAKPALYGIYDVTAFAINNDTIVPTLKDSVVWKQFVMDRYNFTFKANDKVTYYKTDLDTVTNTIVLTSYQDSIDIYNFKYVVKDSIMNFKGTFHGDSLNIQFKKRDLNTFLLNSRGFNWVNEYPYNR